MTGNKRTRGRLLLVLTVLIAGLLLVGLVAQASVIYVDQSATGGANNGTSWTNAYTDLQSALDVATGSVQIWVAEGIYVPGNRQTDSFTLSEQIALYGGYPSGGGPRDVAGHPTVLSGDVDHNDSGTGGIDADSSDIVGDNAYHVVTTLSSSAPTLDGFIITGGNANGGSNDVREGGGVFNVNASLTMVNCTIQGNFAASSGGGMYYEGAHLTLRDCTFKGNDAGYRGGAMYNYTFPSANVTGCTFSANTAGRSGGAMYNDSFDGSTPFEVTDCTFVGNSAGPYDYADGGAIYNDHLYESTLYLTNCTFTGNHVTGQYAEGGAMYDDPDSYGPVMTYCTITGNSADCEGGGLYSRAVIGATIVAGNSAPTDPDTYGGFASQGYNLIEDASSFPTVGTDITGVDPKLGPLADNGGPVETCALKTGSPAIDVVPAAAFPSITTDARGITRPQGSACDIGAFEKQPLGDINGDGVINVLDVRLCLQIALGVIPGTAVERQRADMNGDGQVTLADAQLLADYVAGVGAP